MLVFFRRIPTLPISALASNVINCSVLFASEIRYYLILRNRGTSYAIRISFKYYTALPPPTSFFGKERHFLAFKNLIKNFQEKKGKTLFETESGLGQKPTNRGLCLSDKATHRVTVVI